MHNITPTDFINTLFPPYLLLPNEVPVIAYPDSFISNETGKRVDYFRQQTHDPRLLRSKQSWYVCCSTVEAQETRQVKKRLQDVRTAVVLVVDDVGTKSDPPPVPPSYQLETSAGNFQWGYLLEPYDVASPKGQAYYDSILYSLAQAGMNDPGFRSASRLIRIPESVHKTGFRARIVDWHPDWVWTLPDLAKAFQIPLETPRKSYALKPGKYDSLTDVADPLYAWLVNSGRVWGHNDQWVFIECPWRERHTDGYQGGSSTAYSPDDYGQGGRGFKCLHGHCAKRDLADFITWYQKENNS